MATKKSKTFEEKLLDWSSEEKLKSAKQILKHQGISCVYRSGVNTVSAASRSGSTLYSLMLHPGEEPEVECTCGDKSTKLCEHAVALIMYYSRFSTPWTPEVEETSKYAGLKHEPLSKLGSQEKMTGKSYLTIEANSAFPHVPSKWENAVFCIKLHTKDREYLGNVSNLRQLYFDKTLTVSVKLTDFSLQDQQIIRFLAINGEPDGPNILLNSEQAADFFHSLVDFERFTRNGKPLYIRGQRAEAVMLRHAGEDGITTYSPGVRINGKLLPISNAKVVTGRSGCWVGCAGEYFFVQATVDVGWLRNFFRSTKEEVPGTQAAEWERVFPLPVISADDTDVPESSGRVLIGGSFDSIGNFRLQIDYSYDGNIFATNSGTLACSGEMLTRREQEKERDIEQELLMYGFEIRGSNWILEDIYAAGVFLDKVLPRWRSLRSEIFCSGKYCTGEVPEAEFAIQSVKECDGGYLLNYAFSSGGKALDIREGIRHAHENSEFMPVDRGIVKLDGKMRRFLVGLESCWQNIEEKMSSFKLPTYALNYYCHLAQPVEGAMPEEFLHHPLLSQGRNTTVSRAPHERRFKFTGDLRQYQRDGVNYLAEMTNSDFNVILADEMGLGKTVQLLAMLAENKDPAGYPALLICPASLLTNWVRETNRFVPELKAVAAEGNNRTKIWESREQYDLIIISYASARLDIDKLKKMKFDYLILDEAQHIKNPGTANAQICKAIESRHRIVLTGTPLENSPEDLWSIFDFLHPGMLGSFAKFKKQYAKIGEDPSLGAELAARVAPFIKRRTKKSVALELPPKEEQLIFCELTEEQRSLYETVLETGRRELARSQSAGSGNMEIFTTLLRLRQICCDPELLPEEFKAKAISSAKIDLLLELVLEHIDSGHKLLIFSQFTSLLSIIGRDLTELGISYEYLDGSTRNRQDKVDNFNNNPDLQVFLLSLKAGGTGLNLTSADTVIICDPWWNPAAELQAADRTHRIGQTRQVSTIKLLVKDSIEEKILDLQAKKQEIFNQVIDSTQTYSEKLSIEELRFLLD